MTCLVSSLTYHNNNTISITEITNYRGIHPTSENKHTKGAETWTLEKESNAEGRENFYSQTYTF
jgi:hypothetical protein